MRSTKYYLNLLGYKDEKDIDNYWSKDDEKAWNEHVDSLYKDTGINIFDIAPDQKENEDTKCIVVNLFGAPGAGKSTGAAYIFSKLKMNGVNAELVTEFAKDKVWEENSEVFKPNNQIYLLGKQFYRMSRCKDKVNVIVTDSPLPLSILYNKSTVLSQSFNDVVMDCYNIFDNMNYFVKRNKPYNQVGRLQTEAESDVLAANLIGFLIDSNIEHDVVYGEITEYDKIVREVLERIKIRNLGG